NRNLGTITVSNNLSIDNDSGNRNFNFDGGTSVFRNNTSCRFSSGTNDRIVGNSDSSNQFWMGANGSRCANFSGALAWSFASDGRLVVTLGGRVVTTRPWLPAAHPRAGWVAGWYRRWTMCGSLGAAVRRNRWHRT